MEKLNYPETQVIFMVGVVVEQTPHKLTSKNWQHNYKQTFSLFVTPMPSLFLISFEIVMWLERCG